MDKYSVKGMSCAACQARVEKAVGNVPGVESCAVSLLTNSMGVEGTADPKEIIKAIENAGYGASVISSGESGAVAGERIVEEGGALRGSRSGSSGYDRIREQEKALEDTLTPALKKRLIKSLLFLALLMYFSMGHMMFGMPLPGFFDGNHVAVGIIELILSAIILLINKDFFTSGFKSLGHLAPNMDSLVAIGSMTSFVWSTLILFKMTADQAAGDAKALMLDMNSLYFESAAMIVTLITVGKLLEAMSKGKTTDALKSLMKLAPETAVILADGIEQTVRIEYVSVGDIFVVRPGDSIPVDGLIIEGQTAVDESALTGESIPVDKAAGDEVSAGTINKTGYFRAEALKVGEDTTLAKIIDLVSDAAATKAPVAKMADKVAGVFVPFVIVLAILVTIIWLLVGREAGYALARGIAVLVVSCPCALGLATPVAIMVANGKAARNGILFKTAASIEETGRVRVIALDKTGTITSGRPVVTDVVPAESITKDKLLAMAVTLESKSEHPLAAAIVEYGRSIRIKPSETDSFEALPGNGLFASISGINMFGGNRDFIGDKVDIEETMVARAEELAEEGKTPIFFAAGEKLYGIIAVRDEIKADSREAIHELKDMGIRVVMLTGDNEKTASAIGREVGIDEIVAGVKPEDKANVISMLSGKYCSPESGGKGKVAMVGDGINDAPALTGADVGIAIGAGTNVAIDAADVVLMNSSLTDAAAAIRLSRQTLRNIKENLFWAFFYNVLLIPLAAGAFTLLLNGWTMNPMLGAAAMSLSSFCVCMNALRLNLFKTKAHGTSAAYLDSGDDSDELDMGVDNKGVYGNVNMDADDNGLNKGIRNEDNDTEESKMEKKLVIEGMMCGHCEAAVKKALEALDGVGEATVSHEQGTALVKLESEVSDEILKKAVEEKDYTVLSVE